MKKVRALFIASREVIDWLNKVIHESILARPSSGSSSHSSSNMFEVRSHAKALRIRIRILKKLTIVTDPSARLSGQPSSMITGQGGQSNVFRMRIPSSAPWRWLENFTYSAAVTG